MPEVQYPLFVYGTLLTGERAHSLLASSLDRVERATMPSAALYNLGAYPMLVDGASQVTGEVCWIKQDLYGSLLASLDGYEGSQYVREVRTVQLCGDAISEGAESVQAWVYIGREIPSSSAIIRDGDWRQHHAMKAP